MKPPRQLVSRRDTRGGASLVEVLLSIAILGILAIAATSFFEHAGSGVEQSRNRRVALEVASGRMEALRQSLYESISPASSNGVFYLEWITNGTWSVTPTDPDVTVSINGKEMPIQTRVQYLDVDSGPLSHDYLLAQVRVGYRVGGDERVMLESRISP